MCVSLNFPYRHCRLLFTNHGRHGTISLRSWRAVRGCLRGSILGIPRRRKLRERVLVSWAVDHWEGEIFNGQHVGCAHTMYRSSLD